MLRVGDAPHLVGNHPQPHHISPQHEIETFNNRGPSKIPPSQFFKRTADGRYHEPKFPEMRRKMEGERNQMQRKIVGGRNQIQREMEGERTNGRYHKHKVVLIADNCSLLILYANFTFFVLLARIFPLTSSCII